MRIRTKWTVTARAIGVLAAMGLGAIPMTASADFIDGVLTFGGPFTPTGGTGDNLGDATGLDFLGDVFYVYGATGDFVTQGIGPGSVGQINDFQFNPLTPAPHDLWSVGGFTFSLEQVTIVQQTSGFLDLFGRGTLRGNGYEDTAGSWSLSAQGLGTSRSMLFSFSGGFAVPEPGTLLLLGAGLAGLMASRRRAVAKA